MRESLKNFLYGRALAGGLILIVAVWCIDLALAVVFRLLYRTTDVAILIANEGGLSFLYFFLYVGFIFSVLYGVMFFYFMARESSQVWGMTAGAMLGAIYSAFFVAPSVLFGQAHMLASVLLHPTHVYYSSRLSLEDIGAAIILMCITAVMGYFMGSR